MDDSVISIVCGAYSDSNTLSSAPRNLNFRSTEWLPVWLAINVMEMALGSYQSYNEFTPSVLKYLDNYDDILIQLAREGSVCVYIRGLPLGTECQLIQDALSADECTWDTEVDSQFPDNDCVVRVWWD